MSEVLLALSEVTAETFEPHLGGSYRVTDSLGNHLDVVLTDLQRRPRHPEIPREPFSLIFRGPREVSLRQGTYRFEAPDGVTLEFFVVPIGPGPGGVGLRYEAVFS